MSYILDALKKAENDRNTQQTSSLGIPIPAPINPTKPVPWIVISSLLIVILGLIVYIFLPNKKENEINYPATPVEKSKPIETGSSSTSKIPQRPAQLTRQIESSIAELMNKQTLTRPTTKKTEATKNNERKRSAPENIPAPTVAKTRPKAKQPEKTQNSKNQEQRNTNKTSPVNGQKITSANVQKQTQSVSDKKEIDKIPWLSTLSSNFKRNLPALNVNVFVYDENPKARFVVVNMRKFRPGQKISDDILLEDITPHSMILKFDGKTFRIPRP
ncbi:MAG: general secretion pathway protein GspB [Methylococcales bacterium]